VCGLDEGFASGMKTYVPKPEQIRRNWWVVDADGLALGRVATQVATRLRGKHKPDYTPYLDTGDHVIVVNAGRLVLTGQKSKDKMYRRHTGYPGGLREVAAEDLLRRHPERVVELAVKGMLPKGPLGRRIVRKLKVYAGPDHPHQAQSPQPLAIARPAAKD
jgi:large subunit ribosomal protein L13